jgi:hypothetical protein
MKGKDITIRKNPIGNVPKHGMSIKSHAPRATAYSVSHPCRLRMLAESTVRNNERHSKNIA